ncbi:MAG: gas vesicle protein K [Chloroflexi bacterium]|nr:gas vesicle protein K [Chloroflexota bacterium]
MTASIFGKEPLTLVDIADRLLDTGVSVTGEATISVADVDFVYLGLDLILTSVERMKGTGTLADAPGAMTAEMHTQLRAMFPARLDVDPSEVEKGLAKLVLTIVEFLRQVLERRAIHRMEGGTLTDAEVERVGTALMRLEEKLIEMAGHFGLTREDLRLGLGPLGELV